MICPSIFYENIFKPNKASGLILSVCFCVYIQMSDTMKLIVGIKTH